jgi:type II secretory pathway component GspD/PulD (secretin)
MLKMNQSKGGSEVPLLGRIPLIGSLFKSVSNSDIQRNLYVFVKAEIIRPPDKDNSGQIELKRISEQNRKSFEEYEREFQEYQSFPGIKPTPISPAKVLGEE